MDIIDEKRVHAYLEGDGTLCPYCGSWHIAPLLPLSERPYQLVHCNECGMDWRDIYRLVGIKRPDGVDIIPDDPEITKLRKALQAILERAEVAADKFDGEVKQTIEKLNDIAFVALLGAEKTTANKTATKFKPYISVDL